MELKLRAYPKVNIGLYVGGKRPDGYHSLVSIFQKAHEFFDEISIRLEDSPFPTVTATGLKVSDDDNTMVRAAKLWLEKTDLKASVSIKIEKNIPMKAGLGGGSSDAATVLIGLNSMSGKRLSEEELMETGLEIGSDVPFFLAGCEAAVVSGRGETVKPVKAKKLHFELADSGFEKPSTGEAYRCLDEVRKTAVLPSEEEMISIYGMPVSDWKFENSFSALYPELPEGCLLTGSGSWYFRVSEVD